LALVVNVSKYESQPHPELDSTQADADALVSALIEKQSFDIVVELSNELATADNIHGFLRFLLKEGNRTSYDKTPPDPNGYRIRFLFAFSGHGVPGGTTPTGRPDSAKLILWNGSGAVGDPNTLSLKTLDDALQDIKGLAYQTLVLINSCYSGAYFANVTAKIGGDEYNYYLKGSRAITSSDASDLSYSDPSKDAKGSIFFDGFLSAISTTLNGVVPTRTSGQPPDIITLSGVKLSINEFLQNLSLNKHSGGDYTIWEGPIDASIISPGGFFFLVPRERQQSRAKALTANDCVRALDHSCELPVLPSDQYPVTGVDASATLNPDINWRYVSNARNTWQFAYLRGSFGLHSLNPQQLGTLRGALDALSVNPAFRIGLYHVFTFCDPAPMQIAAIKRLRSELGGARIDLPLAVDFEATGFDASNAQAVWGQCPAPPDMHYVQNNLKQFLAAVKQTFGKAPVLYVPISALKADLIDAELKQYPLWVADYSAAAAARGAPRTDPGTKWVLWQYGQNRIGGPGNSQVDRNVFHGTVEDFQKFSMGQEGDKNRTDGKESEELIASKDIGRSWTMPTGDYTNTRYSQLSEINVENVHKLAPAWTFSTGVLRGHEGAPVVIGDVMYVHTPFPNTVFALDLNNDGKILWKYEPKQDPDVIQVMCCDTVNRGVSYADGKIFLHQADTTLVALDAKSGAVVWSVKDGDPSKGQTGTSAPMVFKDKVFVGISGGEFGVRGWISAYDLKTGKLAWRGYSIGPDSDTLIDPEKTTSLGKPVGKDSSTSTWQGDQWKIGGGTTWGWYSYDPDLNLMYYGSGNPSPWNAKQRPGDNKWSMSIWARDVDTGAVKWVYQMVPNDQWGFDGVNEMILTDQKINGQDRKLLTHFDFNGFGYTLDRTNGELLAANKYDPKVNWVAGIDMDESSPDYGRPIRVMAMSTEANGEDVSSKGICPATLGAKNEQPAAYSPQTELFYVPTNHLCMDYEPFKVSYTIGQPYVGATLMPYPPPGDSNMGNFIAWDGKTGKIVWSDPEQFSVWSGALATAGGVVFYGTLEGYLKAVDAKTGRELYKFKTPSGIIGNVMTYEHGGRQYVAVLSGVGGWAGIGLAAGLTKPTDGLGAVGGYAGLSNYTALGGTLTVFALPTD
jgi:PQQ-dependent dehydrogenase (methanol/ethanol family)